MILLLVILAASTQPPRADTLQTFLEKEGLDTRMQYLTGCWLLIRQEPSILQSRQTKARAMRQCYNKIPLKAAVNLIVGLVDNNIQGSLSDIIEQPHQHLKRWGKGKLDQFQLYILEFCDKRESEIQQLRNVNMTAQIEKEKERKRNKNTGWSQVMIFAGLAAVLFGSVSLCFCVKLGFRQRKNANKKKK